MTKVQAFEYIATTTRSTYLASDLVDIIFDLTMSDDEVYYAVYSELRKIGYDAAYVEGVTSGFVALPDTPVA